MLMQLTDRTIFEKSKFNSENLPQWNFAVRPLTGHNEPPANQVNLKLINKQLADFENRVKFSRR